MTAIILLVALIGGGFSAAAERSLPGDSLYPVKVELNENVRAWAAVSAEAEASLQTKLAERRLEEAEKLAVEGTLNADARAKIESEFDAHVQTYKQKLDEFEDKDSAKALSVTSNFKNSLQTHVRIMEDISAGVDNETRAHLNGLIDKARAERDNAVRDEEQLEAKVKAEARTYTQTAAQGKMKAAMNKIAEVKGFVDARKETMDDEAKANVEARIRLAEETLAQGKAQLDAGVYGEAFILFQESHNVAQQAKLLVRAKAEFEASAEGSAKMKGNGDNNGNTGVNGNSNGNTNGNTGAGASASASATANSNTQVEVNDNSAGANTNGEAGIEIDLGF